MTGSRADSTGRRHHYEHSASPDVVINALLRKRAAAAGGVSIGSVAWNGRRGCCGLGITGVNAGANGIFLLRIWVAAGLREGIHFPQVPVTMIQRRGDLRRYERCLVATSREFA